MESLFDAPAAKRRRLPPAARRLIVDLKAEYPAFNLNEIVNVSRTAFGRKPDVRSVGRVLEEEPVPLKIVRNYPPYHEARDVREARAAIVELRLSGWSVKAIAGYFGVHHATVYRVLESGKREGVRGPSARISRTPARGEEDGLRSHRGDPQARAEPGLGRLPRPRGPRADGLRPQPRHLRQDPRANPRGLRLREARKRGRAQEGDALRQPRSATRSGAPTCVTWT
jgi:Homeodomain-like domain